MTMGLKIHKMIREDTKDPPEIKDEAKRRRDMSDSILEIIYNRIMNKKDKNTMDLIREEEESWED
jgi:hypothetical protein